MKALTAPLYELAEFEEGQSLLKRIDPASATRAVRTRRSFIWQMG